MTHNALYTDLSNYYDLMCADIDYRTQSLAVQRLHHIFGSTGRHHLDLACGTGPHIRHFIDHGYQSTGIDINQPMLDMAQLRCPEAHFSCQDMCTFEFDRPVDIMTCFLYSIHYCGTLSALTACIQRVYQALNDGGVFCFNVVDKTTINNQAYVRHSVKQLGSEFTFSSSWYYQGDGEQQALRLRIDKQTGDKHESWMDEHPMVAFDFMELKHLLNAYFDVHFFEHDYDRIIPWDGLSGNALVVCVKSP